MSDAPPAAPEQESDHISGRGAFVVIVAGVVVLLAAVAVSAGLLRSVVRHLGTANPSRKTLPALETHANGRLEQTLIESTASGWQRRAAQTRVLEHYAWIDRPRGVLHIPIERAMDLIVADGGTP